MSGSRRRARAGQRNDTHPHVINHLHSTTQRKEKELRTTRPCDMPPAQDHEKTRTREAIERLHTMRPRRRRCFEDSLKRVFQTILFMVLRSNRMLARCAHGGADPLRRPPSTMGRQQVNNAPSTSQQWAVNKSTMRRQQVNNTPSTSQQHAADKAARPCHPRK